MLLLEKEKIHIYIKNKLIREINYKFVKKLDVKIIYYNSGCGRVFKHLYLYGVSDKTCAKLNKKIENEC